MTTLVTGATGFVGSAVARALAARGHNLRLLTRPSSDRRNLAGLDAEIVTGDLTDPDSLRRAAAGCRYVVHVAADYRILGAGPGRDAASQCRRRAGDGAGRGGGGRRTDRPLQFRRRARADRRRHAGGRGDPDQRGGFRRHLQAVQISRGKGGAGSGAARVAAGGGGQPGRAGRAARHQADADRQDDPGRRGRARAGLYRHRPEHRPCRRRRRGPRPGAGEGQGGGALRPGR